MHLYALLCGQIFILVKSGCYTKRPNLSTYSSGNRSREAVDGEAARSVLADDGGSFRCSSGSDDGGDDRGPSFQRRVDS
jgi:hypothetical protein